MPSIAPLAVVTPAANETVQQLADARRNGAPATPPPSVLMIGNYLSAFNGVRGVCEDLSERLAQRGWRVYTASSKPGRAARLADMLWAAWRHRRHYAVAQVDVYSGPSFRWAEAVCRLLRLLDKPYVLTLHGGNLPAFARRYPRRMRRLLRNAAAVTCPSAPVQRELSQYGNAAVLLPNPIAVAAYPYRHRQIVRPSFVWLRHFHSIYNPGLAVRALAGIIDGFPESRMWMIGPAKPDGSLAATRKLAQELGVLQHITFPGGVAKTEVAGWLQRGDIFLNTTNIDNAPVSVLEAMACGLCVISTNVGGITSLIEHGSNGLLVPPDEPAAMAAAIRRLLSDHELAARLSQGARQTAEMRDWRVILPRWQRLLSAAASDGGAAGR